MTRRAEDRQAKYSGLLTHDGTFVDDVLVYRMAPSHFMFLANASNVKKDYAWISEQIKAVGDARRWTVQPLRAAGTAGAGVAGSAAAVDGVELSDIRPYWVATGKWPAPAHDLADRLQRRGRFSRSSCRPYGGTVWQAVSNRGGRRT